MEFQWSWAYELRYSEMLALALAIIGESDMVARAAQAENPQQALIDDVKTYNPKPDRVRPTRLLYGVALLMASFYSVRSLSLYSKSRKRQSFCVHTGALHDWTNMTSKGAPLAGRLGHRPTQG